MKQHYIDDLKNNDILFSHFSESESVVLNRKLLFVRSADKMMEGNRDEAEKCLNIAVKVLEDGNKDKALKFLYKAEKLYPTKKAKGK